jgi:beta-lactamase regulating signal transducer with metallopeptidase domain
MYFLFLKKETFFTSNRWYLLLGLISSFVLPLITFTKTVWVESKPAIFEEMSNYQPVKIENITEVENTFNWNEILIAFYSLIAIIVLLKIGFEIASFFRNIKNQERKKEAHFTLVNSSTTDNPFSFFSYIVVNQQQFSEEELHHILIHESIHVKQKHSFDVLFSKIICAILWVNPVVWLYRKAIIQNLEFIADHQTYLTINNKYAYQKTLLKVVISNNQSAITNQFFQSLIKKRIVMLNKNQSNKRNSWKYAVVIPALIAFVFLFQIKVVAQEKSEKNASYAVSAIAVGYSTDKNATDEEMKNDTKTANEQLGIDYKFSNVKRNDKGEIIAIKIEYKTKEGKSGKIELDSDNPIETIYFNADGDKVGFSKMGFQNSSDENSKQVSISYDDAINSLGGNNENAATAILVEAQFSENDIYNPIDAIRNNKEINAKKALILFDGNEISYQDLDKIDIKTISSSGSTVASHAFKKYGDKGKNGVIFINTKNYDSEHNPYLRELYKNENNKSSKNDDFPNPPKPPTPLTAPSVSPITNEKELKKFEGLTNDVEHPMEDNRKEAIENRKALLMKRKEALQKKIFINQEKSDYKQSVKDLEQSKMDIEQAKKDIEQAKKDIAQSKLDLIQAKKDIEQAKKDLEQAKKK